MMGMGGIDFDSNDVWWKRMTLNGEVPLGWTRFEGECALLSCVNVSTVCNGILMGGTD